MDLAVWSNIARIRALRLICALGVRRRRQHDVQANPPAMTGLHATRWCTIAILTTAWQRNRFEVQAQLDAWADAGWLEVEEHKDQAGWSIERARLSPRLVEQQAAHNALVRTQREQQGKEIISETLAQWKADHEQALLFYRSDEDIRRLLMRLAAVFEQQEEALQQGSLLPLAGTTHTPGGQPHLRWLAILRGILELLAHPRTEYERVFSARWLRDSKALRLERDEVEAFLTLPGGLERLGIVKHTPLVRSWGAWQAKWDEFTLDGRAGVSFVVTPADTVAQLRDMRVEAEDLFIIENETPFEILVRPSLRRPHTLYLCGAGLPGQAQRTLASLWLQAQPALTWSVWTDYDPGGVAIQRFWHEWAIKNAFRPPSPYRWTEEDFALWQPQGIALRQEQRDALTAMNHPLAHLLLKWGYSAEQEAILAVHSHW